MTVPEGLTTALADRYRLERELGGGGAIGHAPRVTAGRRASSGPRAAAFRNRLFRYPVERLGFTAVAIACGFS